MDSDSVERKKAMVSISKPTRRRARRVRKYSHITPVSSRKVSGIITVAFSPSLMVSWSAVRAWNTVRSTSPSQGDTGGMPAAAGGAEPFPPERGGAARSPPRPMPTTSPYWTGAEPSTRPAVYRHATLGAQVVGRPGVVRLRIRAACCRDTTG